MLLDDGRKRWPPERWAEHLHYARELVSESDPAVFGAIDVWASHAYSLSPLSAGPWEQAFQIDLLYGASVGATVAAGRGVGCVVAVGRGSGA